MMAGRWLLMGCAAFTLTGQVHAEIFGATGDLDVGPAQDFLKPGIVCHDPNILFRMYEQLPAGTDQNVRKSFFMSYFTPLISKGACGVVTASTAYVIGIRTAMIRKENGEPASKYVVAMVSLNGERVYVTPDGLQQTGFEIIKAAQDENRKNGAPLVQ